MLNKKEIGPQYSDENKNRITHYVARIRNANNKLEYITISREQIEKMYSLYSRFGSNLSAAAVAQEFEFTIANMKRIFNDLGIRKDMPAIAPHVMLENPDPVLDEMSINDRIHYAAKRGEMLNSHYDKQTIAKLANECDYLREMISDINGMRLNVGCNPIRITSPAVPSAQSLNVYLADLHIGAVVPQNGLYDENKNYGKEEVIRRLTCVLNGISDLGHFNTINVVLLGDSIDCAGKKCLTSRGHGPLDENMEPLEQVDTFVDVTTFFISSLVSNNMANKYRLFAVPCGNHDDTFGTLAHKLLINAVRVICPDVESTCWNQMIGYFEQDGASFLCLHGKDGRYMKHPMPDVINDKGYHWFNDYVLYKKLNGDIFHIIKGDLHTETQSSSCRRFTYRNALSLFGASEYANNNYTRNSYGVSYDIVRNGNLIRGTFQDM